MVVLRQQYNAARREFQGDSLYGSETWLIPALKWPAVGKSQIRQGVSEDGYRPIQPAGPVPLEDRTWGVHSVKGIDVRKLPYNDPA
jgi:hypothetical protein